MASVSIQLDPLAAELVRTYYGAFWHYNTFPHTDFTLHERPRQLVRNSGKSCQNNLATLLTEVSH